MFLSFKCNKCNNLGILDIGDKSISYVKEQLENSGPFHCDLGYHVEITSRKYYYEVNFDLVFNTYEEAKEYNDSVIKSEIIDLKNIYN